MSEKEKEKDGDAHEVYIQTTSKEFHITTLSSRILPASYARFFFDENFEVRTIHGSFLLLPETFGATYKRGACYMREFRVASRTGNGNLFSDSWLYCNTIIVILQIPIGDKGCSKYFDGMSIAS